MSGSLGTLYAFRSASTAPASDLCPSALWTISFLGHQFLFGLCRPQHCGSQKCMRICMSGIHGSALCK